MFKGFTQETFDFLAGIRTNNNKEWFEEHKAVYTESVLSPLKELGEELFRPFDGTAGMMYKVGRIYRDATFPPYLHYRDVMWIYVRYEAMYWNKTPALFFELSPEGAEFGFRIAKPEPALMERFRKMLADDPETFPDMVERCRKEYGMKLSGDEYKRCKPCENESLKCFFNKKGLALSVTVPSVDNELFSSELVTHVNSVFKALVPINNKFHELVALHESEKQLRASVCDEAEAIVKAPEHEFMW